jgi:hypothetical protein
VEFKIEKHLIAIHAILADKKLKAKRKVEAISTMLLEKKIAIDELIEVSKNSIDKNEGTCIEAIEFATRVNLKITSALLFDYITSTLMKEALRVK